MSSREIMIAIVTALCLGGCKGGKIHIPDPVKVCRTACDARGLAGASATEVHLCLLRCDGKTPSPTAVMPTPTETPAPSPTNTPIPAPEQAVRVKGDCTPAPGAVGPFDAEVEKAERDWLDANTSKWDAEGLGGMEFGLKGAAVADEFQFAIVRVLRSDPDHPRDAVVEANGSGAPNGSIVIAWKDNATEHHAYALVVGGSWHVRFPSRRSSYREKCVPRGFDVGLPGPTAAPAPTAPPAAYAPPQLDKWRGCKDDNMSREIAQDGTGRAKRYCDTTMHWYCPMVPVSVGGTRNCDPEHETTFALCCSGRRADDPRGPEYRVKLVSGGPVEIRQPCRNGNYFNVCFFAPAGTVALIDTCPRPDAYTCVVSSELPNIDTGIKYDPSIPQTDCPSGKIPIPVRGTGCYGEQEVRF